jgi:hypothetical protein
VKRNTANPKHFGKVSDLLDSIVIHSRFISSSLWYYTDEQTLEEVKTLNEMVTRLNALLKIGETPTPVIGDTNDKHTVGKG